MRARIRGVAVGTMFLAAAFGTVASCGLDESDHYDGGSSVEPTIDGTIDHEPDAKDDEPVPGDEPTPPPTDAPNDGHSIRDDSGSDSGEDSSVDSGEDAHDSGMPDSGSDSGTTDACAPGESDGSCSACGTASVYCPGSKSCVAACNDCDAGTPVACNNTCIPNCGQCDNAPYACDAGALTCISSCGACGTSMYACLINFTCNSDECVSCVDSGTSNNATCGTDTNTCTNYRNGANCTIPCNPSATEGCGAAGMQTPGYACDTASKTCLLCNGSGMLNTTNSGICYPGATCNDNGHMGFMCQK